MKIVAIPGSLRAASLNRRLIELAARHARAAGAEVELVDLRALDLPLYDGDLEERDGIPAGAAELAGRLAAADGFLIATPEYNLSIPGGLKNAIDWVSRTRPQPFQGTPGMILSASPSLVGGNRGALALRVPLDALGAHLHPATFSLASAHEAFADDGSLADPEAGERLASNVAAFLAFAGALGGIEGGR